MRIAFIYDAVYPWVKGGAEKRIYEISKRLVKKGHEVHWYGIKWWDNESNDIKKEGIYFHGVCKPISLYNADGKRSLKEALYFSLKLFPALYKEKFDIIDCQNFPFFPYFPVKLYSLIRNQKLIITFHEIWGDYWYEYLGKKGFFGKIVEKMLISTNGNFIAVSKSTQKKLLKIKHDVNVEIIPNGIDTKIINQVVPSSEKSDVIFVGRLIKEKNVDMLIKAINLVKREIPSIKCCIIGDGPEKKKLKRLVADLNLNDNIQFLGFLEEYVDLISYLKSSKVFVLPSTREGFGIVVLEANASGLPVIVMMDEMNASKDLIINDSNGFISEFSEELVSKNIQKTLYKVNILKNNCIENSKKYDWDIIFSKIENFYYDV